MRLFSFFVLFILSCSCGTGAPKDAWPGISFIVMDEIPEEFKFNRTENIIPTVQRVVLLPIVENYQWEGKRISYAIANPILVFPGKEPLDKTFSPLVVDNQKVRRCIVLARGYCPGTLQPVINYAGIYKGKEAWIVELAKVSKKQYAAEYAIVMNELSGTSLLLSQMPTTNDIWNYEVALDKGQLLRRGIIKSPVIRTGGYKDTRSEIVLWSLPGGMNIPICMTPQGRKLLKDELMPK